MSEKQLRIGLLGCGSIAQFAHLPALAKAHGVRLAALCDAADDLLDTMGDRYGVATRYTDFGRMLAEAEIDAVVIAIADPFHVPLSIQALRAGKHVLVEKPLGEHSAECRKLIAVVEQSGLKLQVGSMKRHDPGLAFAKEFIGERMGGVLSLSGWYCDTLFRPAMQETLLPPTTGSAKSKKPLVDPRADKRHYSLVTHGAHLFDNIRFLGGEVKAVTAVLAGKFGQHTWHGLIEFAHGGAGHFELTVKVNADWSEGYVVYGEHGSIHAKTFLPFYYRSSDVRAFDARTQQWHTPLGAHSNPYKNQIEAFARAVLNDEPVNPDAYEGLAAVQMIEAVERSVAEGRRVELVEAAT